MRSAIQLAVVALIAATVVVRLMAQEPAALPVAAMFDVVSVKRVTDPSVQLGARTMGGGRLSVVLTVRALVSLAYGYPDTLRDVQLVGSSIWCAAARTAWGRAS